MPASVRHDVSQLQTREALPVALPPGTHTTACMLSPGQRFSNRPDAMTRSRPNEHQSVLDTMLGTLQRPTKNCQSTATLVADCKVLLKFWNWPGSTFDWSGNTSNRPGSTSSWPGSTSNKHCGPLGAPHLSRPPQPYQHRCLTSTLYHNRCHRPTSPHQMPPLNPNHNKWSAICRG